MLRHFFLIAIRNIRRNAVYSSINIIGLAIGLASFILVLTYLNYELSYDSWDPALKQVFRVSSQTDEEVQEQTPAPLAGLLRSRVPSIEAATMMQYSGEFEVPLAAGEKILYSKGGVCSDSMFLRVFPYELTEGDARTALEKPNAILISQALKDRLFGSADAMGKSIRIFGRIDNEVTGVFREPVGPSHLATQFIWRSPYEQQNNHWNNLSYQTYIKTGQLMTDQELEAQINPLYYQERLKDGSKTYDQFKQAGHQAGLFTDAVADIHSFPKHGSSQMPTIIALLILAFLLLVAGAVNFSNLTIAASVRRAKEVGIRKAMGSGRLQLIRQFLGETALQCLVSVLIALGIVLLALPWFSGHFQVDLKPAANLVSMAWQILVCLLVVILLAGLYPAFFLSMVNTTRVLKGEYASGNKGRRFRSVLMIAQFAVAAFFVFASVMIHRQVNFMESRDRGFNAEQVIRIETSQDTRDAKFEITRARLMSVPGVAQVSKTTEVPGDANADTSTFLFKREAQPAVRLKSVKVSTEYFATLGIKLTAGRLFDGRYADQHTNTVVVNETASRMMGSSILGQNIFFDGCDSLPVNVIGVVKDFQVQGLEQLIQPVAYTIGNNACMFQSGGGILVKLVAGNTAGTLAAIEKEWKTVEGGMPLRSSFVDENFARLFAQYTRLGNVINLFTLIAILISMIGLLATSAYLTAQRTREIGVRKVLGASLPQLVRLLSRDFVLLVAVGILLAVPLAWWAVDHWLQGFVYRVTMSGWVFALASLALLVISFVTVGTQTLRAAARNPVKSLREQ